jgi:type IV pilus assembly protein PilQ
MKRMLKFLVGDVIKVIGICFCMAIPLSSMAFAQELNVIKNLVVEPDSNGPAVKIQTELPVGYRYTVYDSFDPVRVVVDFPGMDTSALEALQSFSVPPVREVRISSFDLESGKLGRIEILLDQATNYEVALKDNLFQVVFSAPATAESLKIEPQGPVADEARPVMAVPDSAKQQGQAAETVESVKPELAPRSETPVAVVDNTQEATQKGEVAPATATETSVPMERSDLLLESPIIEPGAVLLNTSAPLERHHYFSLGSPPRLVVDLYGVTPGFKERSFATSAGMSRVRVGTYADKTRLVFDSATESLPGYKVTKEDRQVKVAWGEETAGKAQRPAPVNQMKTAEGAQKYVASPVTIESLDFNSENGQSVFTVQLSKTTDVIEATQSGDVVRFGVNNALLSQKLRRTVDASAFPSAVKLITPYTVQNGGIQEVRFAVELKGPVSYSVKKNGSLVKLIVEDGPFAEPRGQSAVTKEVLLPAKVQKLQSAAEAGQMTTPQTNLDEVLAKSAAAVQPDSAIPAADVANQGAESVISESQGSYRIAEGKSGYSGQKISLVFDNADIRKILQLIAEVSELNIIASEEVKGNITLRLQEVPWDQALDLIMDIQDLGMVRDGNVARIMPRDRIRSMEEAKLTAKRTKEKLDDLVTEVISISYTALGNIETPAKELLTDRGKITKDDRNKQIIVTDIPSVIADVKNLVSILDTPERQVMIEARIVEADSSFSRDLGVNWGITRINAGTPNNSDLRLGLGGSFLLSPPSAGSSGGSGMASAMTFGLLGSDSTILDLRLSALETSGHGKIVSTPRVTTLNGEKAKISQGTQIPYTVTSDAGANTQFVEAALSLEVTPVINPDGSIILEIKATNSSPGTTVNTGVSGGSAPSIDTKEAETKVLVKDGETTVLGGIFVEDEDYSETGVPWLNKVPILGHLFKSTKRTSSRSELLVFITPRILQ